MSDKSVFFLVWVIFLLVSLRLYIAAVEQAEWTGFYVSEAQLFISAVVLTFILRGGPTKG